MKKLVGLMALVFGVFLMVAPAMAVDCSTITSLDQLIAGGCTIQDKLFTNFSYTASNSNDVAANIIAHADFAPSPTGDQHGWTFTHANTGGTTLWGAGTFTLQYTINAVAPNVTIVASLDQALDGRVGQALPTITDVQSQGVTFSLNDLTVGGLTGFATYSPVTSVTTRSSATIGANGMQSWEQDWFEAAASVPEPTTLILLGFGLLGVMGAARKFKK